MTEMPRSSAMLAKRKCGVAACAAVFAVMISGIAGNAMGDGDQMAVPAPNWRLVTDRVMGGVSAAQLAPASIAGRRCTRLSGTVSTENRGGFVQMVVDVDEQLARAAAGFDGVALDVSGNGESYNLHLRTSDLWLPWQSYRAGFQASAEWQTVRLAFDTFEPYRTGSRLRVDRARRIGVVAIGRDFAADICVANLRFYR